MIAWEALGTFPLPVQAGGKGCQYSSSPTPSAFGRGRSASPEGCHHVGSRSSVLPNSPRSAARSASPAPREAVGTVYSPPVSATASRRGTLARHARPGEGSPCGTADAPDRRHRPGPGVPRMRFLLREPRTSFRRRTRSHRLRSRSRFQLQGNCSTPGAPGLHFYTLNGRRRPGRSTSTWVSHEGVAVCRTRTRQSCVRFSWRSSAVTTLMPGPT